MPQLPTPGEDSGQWGTLLNEYLQVEHAADGSHRASVSTMSILHATAGNSGARVTLAGYHEPGDGGGGVFHWDADSTALDDGGAVIQVAGVTTGRWLRAQSDIAALHFGARSDAREFLASTSGSSITTSGNFFLPGMVGLSVQVYKAGNSNLSFQSVITSVGSATQATVSPAFPTAVTGHPAILGSASAKAAILSAIEYAHGQGLGRVIIAGNFLIGDTPGDIVLQQFLYLRQSNMVYDFSGTLYGCVILANEATYEQITNAQIRNVSAYALGDGINAIGNSCNWNAVGMVEGAGCSFDNIAIRMNGGVRGFSFQSDNLTGGISNTRLTNLRIDGLVDGEKSDGLEIGSLVADTIRDLVVDSVRVNGTGTGVVVSNYAADAYVERVQVSNVSCTDIHVNVLRTARVRNSVFSNIIGHRIGISTASPIDVSDAYSNHYRGVAVYNRGSAVASLCALAGESCVVRGLTLVNRDTTKVPVGVYLFQHGLDIRDVYIENVVTGLYKAGYRVSVDGYTYSNVTNPIRDNTSDPLLNIKDVTAVDAVSTPGQDDASGFLAGSYCSFDGTGAIGVLTPSSAKNVASITKTAIGRYQILFRFAFKAPPVVAGTVLHTSGAVVTIDDTPFTTGISVRVENLAGTLMDSSFVSLVFF